MSDRVKFQVRREFEKPHTIFLVGIIHPDADVEVQVFETLKGEAITEYEAEKIGSKTFKLKLAEPQAVRLKVEVTLPPGVEVPTKG